jgi:ABC-type antimicrobial peptide transport system permease subunit
MNDEGGALRAALVNEAFARRYFPRQDPLGKHFSAMVGRTAADLEIVGVVSDVVANDLRVAAPPTVYVPYFQVQVTAQNFSTLQIRTAGPQAALADAIRRALLPRMLGSPVEIRSLTSQVDAASVRERLMTTLATGLGTVALVLAAIGLYGLLAYSVTSRSRESGIRVALGANPQSVVVLILRQGVGLALGGIAIGVAGAAALSRFLEGMLFGLTPLDPTTFTAVAGLLAGVALVASGIPARRAAKVDPVVSIRTE